MEFLVRIELKNEDKTQSLIASLIEKLSSSTKQVYFANSYIWTLLQIEAENISKVKSLVQNAYNDLQANFNGQIPKDDYFIDVIACSDDEGYNNYLVDMMFLTSGLHPMLSASLDYIKVATVINNQFINQTLKHKCFLVSIDAGYGYTYYVDCLACLHKYLGVFPEMDKTERLEYIISNKTGENKFSPEDAINNIETEYAKNLVYSVDLSYFINPDKHDELRNFIKQIKNYEDQNFYIFRLPFLEEKSFNKIKDILSDVLDIVSVVVPPLEGFQLVDFANSLFLRYGYQSMSPEVIEIFNSKLIQERKDGRFYGFKTILKVVNEFIWQKMKANNFSKEQGQKYNISSITSDELKVFCKQKQERVDSLESLKQMVGMQDVVKQIEQIVAQVELAIKNDKVERPCIHMRFVGAPGTGKTTVARILGNIFKEKGILRKGAFFEYEARSLCADYAGQTAPRTANICKEAYGSVLFLDEAYSLYSKDKYKNDFGAEAVSTLITEMENHRDDMVVIMAGYVDEMSVLMEVNPGLRSRMPFLIEFKNYTPEQLSQIFLKMLSKAFSYEEDLKALVEKYFNNLKDEFIFGKQFSNARFVRNLYERTWAKCAYRLRESKIENISISKQDFLSAIREEDFVEALQDNSWVW